MIVSDKQQQQQQEGDINTNVIQTTNFATNTTQDQKQQNQLPIMDDYTKLDLDKIHSFISLLEEYEQECEEQKNYLEAHAARDRIREFKVIEIQKIKQNLLQEHESQRLILSQEYESILQDALTKMNDEHQVLLNSFTKQQSDLSTKHQDEMQALQNDFDCIQHNDNNNQRRNSSNEDDECCVTISEQLYRKYFKPSKELLNWIKIEEVAIKQKDYLKAHEAKMNVEKYAKVDMEKMNKVINSKYKLEVKKLQKRHDIEMKGFEQKKESICNSFEKMKNETIEIIQKKYKTKMSELENNQRIEMNNFYKLYNNTNNNNNTITLNASKTFSRTQSVFRNQNSLSQK